MSTTTDQRDAAESEKPTTAQDVETPQSSRQPESQTYRQIAATHIDTLSRINAQLPKLLTYFAATISQLTNNPIETPLTKDKSDSIQSRQEALWLMALYTGASIKEIREELVEQINHLERYGVIPAKHSRYTALPADGQSGKAPDPEAGVKNGGYGDFDVGVLNARAASGRIGEEDVLDRLKSLAEGLTRRREGESNGDKMVVDD